IAGGGGLITLPTLLSVGIPPQLALGTNKFQGTFGSCTAAIYYHQKNLFDVRKELLGILFTFIGAAIGTWAVQHMHTEILNTLIPLLLLLIAVYTIFSPSLGKLQTRPRMNAALFYLVIGLALGFYDGFFGPGTGTFWAISYMVLMGFEITRATGSTKLMNFTSNIVSVAVFALGGSILLLQGLIMAAGQTLGAQLGARFAVKKGIHIIRPLFLLVVFATIARLLYLRFF
ncbi:MAG TPA: TSUP family transporter, partial [Bacteroidota bacterium]|nr:TSUP family transporter [Bacteroidota bacterium]